MVTHILHTDHWELYSVHDFMKLYDHKYMNNTSIGCSHGIGIVVLTMQKMPDNSHTQKPPTTIVY